MYETLRSKDYIEYLSCRKFADGLRHDRTSDSFIRADSIKNMFFNFFVKDETQAELVNVFPDKKLLFHIFNMADSKLSKMFSKLLFESIQTNERIKVPVMLFENNMSPNPDKLFEWRVLQPEFKTAAFNLEGLGLFLENFHDTPDAYEIRVLAPFQLQIKQHLTMKKTLPPF